MLCLRGTEGVPIGRFSNPVVYYQSTLEGVWKYPVRNFTEVKRVRLSASSTCRRATDSWGAAIDVHEAA